MVGAVRFELTTSCTRNKRASQATLRPDPRAEKVPYSRTIANEFWRPSVVRVQLSVVSCQLPPLASARTTNNRRLTTDDGQCSEPSSMPELFCSAEFLV